MSSSSLSSSLSLLPPPAGAAASRGGESSLLGAPNGPLAGPFVRSVSQLSPMPQLAPDAPASVVVEAYRRKMEAQPDNPVAVCAIQALTEVVERSKATTLMELQIELKAASEELRAIDRTSIPLGAGCELFNRYVTRISPEQMGFPECRRRLIERGTLFADNSMASRRKISEHGDRFIRHGCSILVHGLSRVVTAVLRHAVKKGKYFSVVVTEGRPFGSG
jgi:translation initiation factor eIF-2B subunit alpha